MNFAMSLSEFCRKRMLILLSTGRNMHA